MQKPKISIITVNLNGSATLEEAIGSISQDYTNKEYIVIDGGSTDSSHAIFEKCRHLIDRLIVEKDEGISDAFNKGVAASTGQVIGIVSSDDYLLQGSLEAVATCFVQNGEPDVVFGNCIYLDPLTGRRSLSRPDTSLESVYFGQPVKHGAMFVSRQAYERYGVFDLRYKAAMDYDLVLRYITQGARFVYLDRELAVIRSGGTCVKMRSLTRTESKDISVRHGCPLWKADAYYRWKIIKDVAKRVIDDSAFAKVGVWYRRRVGRNVPLER